MFFLQTSLDWSLIFRILSFAGKIASVKIANLPGKNCWSTHIGLPPNRKQKNSISEYLFRFLQSKTLCKFPHHMNISLVIHWGVKVQLARYRYRPVPFFVIRCHWYLWLLTSCVHVFVRNCDMGEYGHFIL